MVGDSGARIEGGVLWVHVDMDSGRPIPLGEDFWGLYAEAAQGRKVGVRLAHAPKAPEGSPLRPWPVRFADFDILGHVNNAAYWAAVEEVLAGRKDLRPPFRAEVEYRAPIEPGDQVAVVEGDTPDGGLDLWLVDPATRETYATGRVRLDFRSGGRRAKL
jgi:acyl-ACP thioesterase